MRTRSLATLLLLVVTAWTAMPAWALVDCSAGAPTSASKPHCNRPCPHCKKPPQQRVASASLEKGCCTLRAPAPSQAAEPQRRGAHEVQGPQLVVLPPPA